MIFNTGSGGNATRIVTGKSLCLADTAGGKYKNIKLVGASVQNGTPAVSKPVEIVSNKVKSITAGSKNLLNPSRFTTKTSNGVTFTPVFKDGLLQYINVNGTATAKAYYALTDNIVDVPTESLILNGCKGGSANTYSLLASYRKEDGTTFTKEAYQTDADLPIDTAEKKYLITIYINSGATLNDVKFYPMLRLASISDATYEPYVSNTAELDETYTLNGINGVYDEIDLERGVRVQRFGVQVFKGSSDEKWSKSSSLNGRYVTPIPDAKEYAELLCTHATRNIVNDSLINTCAINTVKYFYINTSFSTLEDWKAHLASNPMTVVYELAEPVETPLSVDELIAFNKLRAYQSGSSLFSDCDMEVEYFLNNKVGQPMADIHMNTAKYILDGTTLNIIV